MVAALSMREWAEIVWPLSFGMFFALCYPGYWELTPTECIMPESLAALAIAMQGCKTDLNNNNASSHLSPQHLLRAKHQLLCIINIFQRPESQWYCAPSKPAKASIYSSLLRVWACMFWQTWVCLKSVGMLEKCWKLGCWPFLTSKSAKITFRAELLANLIASLSVAVRGKQQTRWPLS